MARETDKSKELAHRHVIDPEHTYGTVTDKISRIVLTGRTPRLWFFALGVSFGLLMLFFWAVGNLLIRGVGIWGLNNPVGWGFAIINLVWWIGIGHAGTLISAILLLLRQDWRTSINRFAEAMTLFAVACAGMFPVLHVGRPWVAHWLFPYPNTMGMWPQFRSPLMWDVFAISTYATVSFLFWYIGLIPDLATLRDGAKRGVRKVLYGVVALGWTGSARHWERYETAYLLLAGLAAPLVVSVHTIVSFDFAVGQTPGWHATIFPPYFVAGAIYAGFAMVLTLTIPIRALYNLRDLITIRHIDLMARVTLATSLFVSYGYIIEAFTAWYSGNPYEEYMLLNRMTGPYKYQFWALIFCNLAVPQLLWSHKVRTNVKLLWCITLVVGVGMWLERFVIVVTSLHRDFLPSAWGMYAGTEWDWALFIGSIGLFLSLLFIFMRLLPMISIAEVRTMVRETPQSEASPQGEGG